MDKVTPEMQAAYVEWEAPAEVELKMPRVLALIRAAFFAGWKARLALDEIPEGWFLYGLGESVKPISYRGDRHENTGQGFWCELQWRETGGRLTKATGATPQEALRNCIAALPAID